VQSPALPVPAAVQTSQVVAPTTAAVQVSTSNVTESQAVAPAVAQPSPTPTVGELAGQAQAALPAAPWQVSGLVQEIGAPSSKQSSALSVVQVAT
jgi:hypothetical protein